MRFNPLYSPFLLCLLLASCKDSHENNQSIEIKANYSLPIYFKSAERPFATATKVKNTNLAITVFHAVAGKEDFMETKISDGTRVRVEVIAKEFAFDLALLKIPENNKEGIRMQDFQDRSELKVGERLYQYSSSFGLEDSFKIGYISHLDRSGVDITYPRIPFIQTEGLSSPGSSGSGVFTMEEKFIGIQRADYGYQAGYGVGLVVPSALVKNFLKKNM